MVTIGCGCGATLDWLEPSKRLLQEELDYVILETIGSAATCQAGTRAHEGDPGYHPYLEDRLRLIFDPAAEHGTTIVTNAGIVDPIGAGKVAKSIADEKGLSSQIIAITGDDCMHLLTDYEDDIDFGVDEAISANAYIGTKTIVDALEHCDETADVHIIIGGRLADPSLVVGPLAYEYDWDLEDWDRLGKATVVGHLLECSAQLTGGYFADPPRKTVPDPHRIGYPYAEVEKDGSATVTKPDGTGGRVDRHTVREQLFYEVHDPSAYITPDVVADFTTVELAEVGKDRVEVTGGTGRKRPDDLKVLVGTISGYKFEKFIPVGGPNAVARAEVTIDVVNKRIDHVFNLDRSLLDIRMEILGKNGLYSDAYEENESGYGSQVEEYEEVLLRIAGNASKEELLEPILRTVSTTLPGPAGHGVPFPYAPGGIAEKAEIVPIYVPRERIESNVEYNEITGEEI
ncbi:acyclic terpene utilization AtuA family protein (plasmid) [Haloferacaceae archaeon DSL9]